jgi:hypothetical protein
MTKPRGLQHIGGFSKAASTDSGTSSSVQGRNNDDHHGAGTHGKGEDHDGMLQSGMEGGLNESYAALDRLLATLS